MALRLQPGLDSSVFQQPEEEGSFLGLAGDFLGDAVYLLPRIAEGVYDDTLGALIGDTNRASLFGENQTIAGGLLQDVGEFLTAFMPASGILKAGKFGTKALGLTSAAEKARAATSTLKAGATVAARGAVAGAVADFAVFDGHEERLSNLIESHTPLGNAVTEYLSADESDSEIEGRFKNALEGLLLGGLTEPLFAAIKGLRNLNRGVSIDEALEASEKAALESRNIARTIGEAQLQDTTGALTEARTARAEAGLDSQLTVSKESGDLVGRIFEGLGIDRTGPLGPEAQILERFVDRITPQIHDSIRIKFTKKTSEKSSFDFANRVITISHAAAREGRLAREVIHEVYHALQDYIPAKLRGDLTEAFEGARARAQEIDPDLANRLREAKEGRFSSLRAEDYKYLNEDEWFAEVATAETLADIQKDLDVVTKPQVDGVIKEMRLLTQNVFDVFRGMWGEAPVQRALKALRKDKLSLQIQPREGSSNIRYTDDFAAENAEYISKVKGAYDEVKSQATSEQSRAKLLGRQKKRLKRANPDLSDAEIEAQAKAYADDVITRAGKGQLSIREKIDLFDLNASQRVLNDLRTSEHSADGAHLEVALAKVLADDMKDAAGLGVVPMKEILDEVVDEVAKLAGLSEANTVALLERYSREASDDLGKVQALIPKLMAKKAIIRSEGLRMAELSQKFDVATAGPDQLADFMMELKATSDFMAYTKGFISAWARGLGSLRMDVLDADALRTRPRGSLDTAVPSAKVKPQPQADEIVKRASTPDGIGVDDLVTQRQRQHIIEMFGGEKNARKHVEKVREFLIGNDLEKVIKSGDEAELDELIARMNKMMDEQSRTGVLAMLQDYWYFSLLSNFSTLAVNALSTGAMTFYQPLEQMLGAGVRGATGVITGDALLRQQAGEEAYRAFDQMTGIVNNWRDSMKIAKRSFKERRSFITETELNPEQTRQRNAFDQENLAKLEKAPDALVRSGKWLGRLVGYPSDALRATDEFWKQANYRAYIHSHLMKKARQRARDNGTDLATEAAGIPKEMENYISNGSAITKKRLFEVQRAKILRGNPSLRDDPERLAAETQRAVNVLIEENPEISALAQKAVEVAEQNTFTTPLKPGGTAQGIQNLLNRHPWTKAFVPFFRTPLNIFNQGFERTLLTPKNVERLSAQVADLFDKNPHRLLTPDMESSFKGMREETSRFTTELRSASPEEQAEMMGKLSMAMTTFAAMGGMVSMGMITGGGPREFNERRNLEATGWQPYSLKVGDAYISYARIDPIATFVGVAADFFEYFHMSADEERVEGAFGAGIVDAPHAVVSSWVTSVTKQMTEKTFLQGLANLVDLFENPDTKAGDVITSFAGAATPNILKGARDLTAPLFESDPAMRYTASWLDKMKDKIPGISQTLPPRRNFLGEVVPRSQGGLGANITTTLAGIRYSTVKDDVISKEIAELGLSLQPPKPERHGINLHAIEVRGSTAYDRMLSLRSSVRLNGRTLRQELVRTIQSAEYQRMSSASTFDVDSPRLQAIRTIVNRYHRESYRQLLSESPELALAERQFAHKRRLASLGISLQ